MMTNRRRSGPSDRAMLRRASRRFTRRWAVMCVVACLLTVGVLALDVVEPGGMLPIGFSVGTARAQSGLLVSNHVLTTRVIRAADGSFFVHDVLVGFQRGTVTFQTLTQVILPRGNHRVSMALVDPTGSELERINFSTIRADGDNWTQSLEGTWRNIRFQRSGIHELVLYWEGRPVARFHLVVT